MSTSTGCAYLEEHTEPWVRSALAQYPLGAGSSACPSTQRQAIFYTNGAAHPWTDEIWARAFQGAGSVCSERAGRTNEAFPEERNVFACKPSLEGCHQEVEDESEWWKTPLAENGG
ncbi:uncharacterized protein VSU04_013759 isoform 2-T2 [Chlamydotis macqueenii]